MSSIYDLSVTAASNTTIDGTDVSGATGKVKDGDNVMRSLGAFMAQELQDLGAVNTVGGTGDAITVTLSSGITAYATGQTFRFIAGAANTTAVTINVNSIGAKAIRKISGGTDVALSAGDLAQGETYTVIYRSAANSAAGAWVLVGSTTAFSTNTQAAAGSSSALAVTPANLASVGADIASATTTDLSTATGFYVNITGTTTITGFGTAAAGVERTVKFTGALTLTYNATSLILYSKTNITTYSGLVMTFRSLGSGNWIETSHTKATGAWTPAPNFGGGSTGLSATCSGIWEKNADTVDIWWQVVFSAIGSSTGNLSTGVLPFTPASAPGFVAGSCHTLNGKSLIAGMVPVIVAGSGGLFYYAPTTGSNVQITQTNINNNTEIYGYLRYRAA